MKNYRVGTEGGFVEATAVDRPSRDGRSPSLYASERAELNRRWQDENREAIEAYNQMIEKDGCVFSDGVRTF
jgi:hypothetical protein